MLGKIYPRPILNSRNPTLYNKYWDIYVICMNHNSFIPLLLTTGNSGVVFWEFGGNDVGMSESYESLEIFPRNKDTGKFYDLQYHNMIKFWGKAMKDFDLQTSQKNAKVLQN